MKNLLDLSDVCLLLGLVVIAVAVGGIFGAWWGALAGGVGLVLIGVAIERTRVVNPPMGDA